MCKKTVKNYIDPKIFGLLILFIFISTISFAGFTINMPVENEVIVDSTNFIYESQYYNISYSGSGETLTVDTGDSNLPMTWSWEWCDDVLGVCHLPGWPADFSVEDGDEININYSVIMDTTSVTFTFYFKFTAPSITDSVRCDFSFTANNTAIDNPTDQAKPITAFPNPFKNLTKIVLNKKSINSNEIEISIYNIKGELVRNLTHDPAQNEIIWDGKDIFDREVNSGIYFYKIKNENKIFVDKLIKLK